MRNKTAKERYMAEIPYLGKIVTVVQLCSVVKQRWKREMKTDT